MDKHQLIQALLDYPKWYEQALREQQAAHDAVDAYDPEELDVAPQEPMSAKRQALPDTRYDQLYAVREEADLRVDVLKVELETLKILASLV
jgi:hypothetical protein